LAGGHTSLCIAPGTRRACGIRRVPHGARGEASRCAGSRFSSGTCWRWASALRVGRRRNFSGAHAGTFRRRSQFRLTGSSRSRFGDTCGRGLSKDGLGETSRATLP